MTDQRCYFAVDGGMTKTDYLLIGADGWELSRSTGPGTNHEALPGGIPAAAELLRGGAAALLAENGRTAADVLDAVFGLAGADRIAQRDALDGALGALGFSRRLVCNDGYLGVFAGLPDGVGVCLSNGSGMICCAVGPDGRRARRGGFGDLSGDLGGGLAFARETFRACYDQLFLSGPETAMLPMVQAAFGFSTPREFIEGTALAADPDALLCLCGIFFAAAGQGDPVASAYLGRAAEQAARCIRSAADAAGLTENVPCALSGSIFQRADPGAYRSMIESASDRLAPGRFTFLLSECAPVVGAARWVCARNGLTFIETRPLDRKGDAE